MCKRMQKPSQPSPSALSLSGVARCAKGIQSCNVPSCHRHANAMAAEHSFITILVLPTCTSMIATKEPPWGYPYFPHPCPPDTFTPVRCWRTHPMQQFPQPTCPSCPALAMVLRGIPRLGAQAASRTQSLWPCSACSSSQPPMSLARHTCSSNGNPLAPTRLLSGIEHVVGPDTLTPLPPTHPTLRACLQALCMDGCVTHNAASAAHCRLPFKADRR